MRIMRYYYCFVVSVLDIDTEQGRWDAGRVILSTPLSAIRHFQQGEAPFQTLGIHPSSSAVMDRCPPS